MPDFSANERVEHDTMGEVRIPAGAMWGASTQRAVENFPISGLPVDPSIIRALALIKAVAASVNADLGVLDAARAAAISAAGEALAQGQYADQFPVDVYQTGSGTSTNMNVNEVLAALAWESSGLDIHPNDHVNASQSSNDTFPSAVHLAATAAMHDRLLPALRHLELALRVAGQGMDDVVTAGRTHLMDATPVTLGQRFNGYARQVELAIARCEATLGRLAELPLGGTAVGTGLNAPPGFASAVIAELAARTQLPLVEAADHFEAQSARDGLVEASGALRSTAVSLTKINNDLRWMGSGPRTGLFEIRIPDLQPGSSIMPGKVNPVLPEAMLMVCSKVIGNDATIAWAGASGSFELNVQIPVMGQSLLESINLLTNASLVLADRCIVGIEPNVSRALNFAEGSAAIVTPLNRFLGYERAAKVAKRSLAENRSIREVVIDEGYIDEGLLTLADLDAALNVQKMARPRG